MRGVLIVLGMWAFLAFPECAAAQVVLPWESPEEQPAPAPEEVEESELPLVRARLEGSAEVWVGQTVALEVEVIVPTWFTSAPAFPQLEVENAVALSPEGAVNFVVRSGGNSFAAQSRSYLICTQAGGGYTVPAIKVGVSYALPDGSPSPPKLLASPPVRFAARMPPGAEKAKYFLTTESFQISQSLSGKADALEVGDSLTRTVTMTAENTVGMSLPPLRFEAPEGIRLYPGTPKIAETAERGTLAATRTETATYVPEREGKYRLPEITVFWWDPTTKEMNEASLPAVEMNVQAASGQSPELFASSQADEAQGRAAGTGPHRRLRGILRWAVPLVAAFLLWLLLRRVLALRGLSWRGYLTERRRRRAEAETTYFKQFQRASLSDEPSAVLRHLMRWLDRTAAEPAPPTLRQFAAGSGLPELSKRARQLNDLLFAGKAEAEQARAGSKGLGMHMYNLAAKARRAQKKRGKRQHRKSPLLRAMN
ncbi:MAG: hypothetical protein AB1640_05065 [bacterium]